jgi:hypothetical protein
VAGVPSHPTDAPAIADRADGGFLVKALGIAAGAMQCANDAAINGVEITRHTVDQAPELPGATALGVRIAPEITLVDALKAGAEPVA